MKYEVTLYYHTNCRVVVEAKNKEQALNLAYNEVDDAQILSGLQEDDDPDVKPIKG